MSNKVFTGGLTMNSKVRIHSYDFPVTEITLTSEGYALDDSDTENQYGLGGDGNYATFEKSNFCIIRASWVMYMDINLAREFYLNHQYLNTEIHIAGRIWSGAFYVERREILASFERVIQERVTGVFNGNVTETEAP